MLSKQSIRRHLGVRFFSSIDQRCIALINLCRPSAHKLKQVHAFSLRRGVALSDQDVAKHLVYALVSDPNASPSTVSYARSVFAGIHDPTNVFTWNAMIKGYSDSETPFSALEFYREMVGYGVRPDTHTYPFLLKAVARSADLRVGEKLHSCVLRTGFESLVFVGNALIHMYACCGKVEVAQKVFDGMPYRDLVAWNTVINGFAWNGMPNEALTLFKEMGLDGVAPDGFTVVTVLTTCAEMGALALGRRIHVYMLKVGLIENLHTSNSLLDLYAKSGCVWEAKRVFDEMSMRNVVSWTCLIVGLAVNGFGFEALELFGEMEWKSLVPSQITFVGVLYACSHCGMVDRGFEYFRRMEEEFGIVPLIEHYGCMVDLLSRAGLVKRAYEFIKSMPIRPNAVIWRTLLSACTTHGHLTLAEVVRAELVELEPNHSGDYVLISNLYATERRWSDVQKVRREMLGDGVRKFPGHSLVELGNQVHEFTMGDKSHPQSDAIYAKLAEITKSLRLEGYVPHTRNVYADIEDEEKEAALSYHSEKIAVAFMLINTGSGVPIRVVKNLRICADCHLAIKLISKIYAREIVVRDRSRFHHFNGGSCSCKDYW